jgi:MFS superfamily sulfate permease-like transporter
VPQITIRLPRLLSLPSRVFDLRSGLSGSPKAEILSGITVALALVPEAVAFAFLAGVPPLVGLYAAFIICLLTSVCGGRPGMISGATGAMGVVVVSLVADHGIGYLFPAVVLCGLFQVVVGLLRLGKLIRIVPHPVMLGFVNGLAVVILVAQFGSFMTLAPDGRMEFLSGERLWLMLGLVALTMAIIAILPRLTRAVPSSLAAILVVTGCAVVINATWPPSMGSPGSAEPHAVITVRDMLVERTVAAAVTVAEREKQATMLAAATASLPAGLAAVASDAAAAPALTPEEIAAVRASVDVAAVGIAWNKSKHLAADVSFNEFGSKIYQLHGVLFFGSVSRFRDLFAPPSDPDDVVIDFYFSRVYDQSGLEAINALAERYQRVGKRLHLRHLSDDCRRLLDRAGDLVEVNISADPHYHVLTDRAG